MTCSRATEAETQVYFLLRKYRVQKHYRATTAAKATRYAVWIHGGGQVTEPSTSAEARAAADLLTAKEIVRVLRDSGSDRHGEASQSGAESASPTPHNPEHPHG